MAEIEGAFNSWIVYTLYWYSTSHIIHEKWKYFLLSNQNNPRKDVIIDIGKFAKNCNVRLAFCTHFSGFQCPP